MKIEVKYNGNRLDVYNGSKLIQQLDWEEAVDLYLNIKAEVERKLFIYAKRLLEAE